jgi:hypothetical protein
MSFLWSLANFGFFFFFCLSILLPQSSLCWNYHSQICLMVPKDWTEVIHFLKYHNSDLVTFSIHHIKRFMMLLCVIIDDMNLYQLVRVLPTRFLHYTACAFPCVPNTCLERYNYILVDGRQNIAQLFA